MSLLYYTSTDLARLGSNYLPPIVTVGAVEVCLNVAPPKVITSSFESGASSFSRVSSPRLRMSVKPFQDCNFVLGSQGSPWRSLVIYHEIRLYLSLLSRQHVSRYGCSEELTSVSPRRVFTDLVGF